MDNATDQFKTEFRLLMSSLEHTERQAITKMIDLIDEYTGSAGYKRMMRFLREERRNIRVDEMDEI